MPTLSQLWPFIVKEVFLLWYSVACFGVSFGDVSPYVCSYYFGSVWDAEWRPFWKELLTLLTIYSLCIFSVLVLRAGKAL